MSRVAFHAVPSYKVTTDVRYSYNDYEYLADSKFTARTQVGGQSGFVGCWCWSRRSLRESHRLSLLPRSQFIAFVQLLSVTPLVKREFLTKVPVVRVFNSYAYLRMPDEFPVRVSRLVATGKIRPLHRTSLSNTTRRLHKPHPMIAQ